MILLLLGACDEPARLYTVDPCRLGDLFSAFVAEMSCVGSDGAVEARYAWANATRVGGGTGEGWEGPSFYATGSDSEGGTLSVGFRPGQVGFYASEAGSEALVGFLPAGADPAEPSLAEVQAEATTCDSASGRGSVRLSGLPDGWVDGGAWEADFSAGEWSADEVAGAWSAPWGGSCPLNPSSWGALSISARCDGVEVAGARFPGARAWSSELDALGRVARVSGTWAAGYSVVCAGGGVPASVDASLQGEDGGLRVYTSVLTVTRSVEGEWTVEDTSCGECPAWEVEVEGLPEL